MTQPDFLKQLPEDPYSEANDGPGEADHAAMIARLNERSRLKRIEADADQEAAEISYAMTQARAIKKAQAAASTDVPTVRPSEVAYRAKVAAELAQAKGATDAARQSEYRFAVANAIMQLQRAADLNESHALMMILTEAKNLASQKHRPRPGHPDE